MTGFSSSSRRHARPARPCLKSPLPSPCPSPSLDVYSSIPTTTPISPTAPSALGASTPRERTRTKSACSVAFAPNPPIYYPADEWDRTPCPPHYPLTMQEVLELEAIQRSLPRANQPLDPYTGKRFGGGVGNTEFLKGVPVGLLPLLPGEGDAGRHSASPKREVFRFEDGEWKFTSETSGKDNNGGEKESEKEQEPQLSPNNKVVFGLGADKPRVLPSYHPPHLSHLLPPLPPKPRARPQLTFVALLDDESGAAPTAASATSPTGASSTTTPTSGATVTATSPSSTSLNANAPNAVNPSANVGVTATAMELNTLRSTEPSSADSRSSFVAVSSSVSGVAVAPIVSIAHAAPSTQTATTPTGSLSDAHVHGDVQGHAQDDACDHEHELLSDALPLTKASRLPPAPPRTTPINCILPLNPYFNSNSNPAAHTHSDSEANKDKDKEFGSGSGSGSGSSILPPPPPPHAPLPILPTLAMPPPPPAPSIRPFSSSTSASRSGSASPSPLSAIPLTNLAMSNLALSNPALANPRLRALYSPLLVPVSPLVLGGGEAPSPVTGSETGLMEVMSTSLVSVEVSAPAAGPCAGVGGGDLELGSYFPVQVTASAAAEEDVIHPAPRDHEHEEDILSSTPDFTRSPTSAQIRKRTKKTQTRVRRTRKSVMIINDMEVEVEETDFEDDPLSSPEIHRIHLEEEGPSHHDGEEEHHCPGSEEEEDGEDHEEHDHDERRSSYSFSSSSSSTCFDSEVDLDQSGFSTETETDAHEDGVDEEQQEEEAEMLMTPKGLVPISTTTSIALEMSTLTLEVS